MRIFYLQYEIKDAYGQIIADGETDGRLDHGVPLTFQAMQTWRKLISDAHDGARTRITMVMELEA